MKQKEVLNMESDRPLTEDNIVEPIVVYCDGGKRYGMAYGSFKLYDNTGKLLYYEPFVLGDCSNNYAEYEAVLRSLKAIRKYYPDVRRVDVRSDSLLVVCQVNNDWACKKAHLRKIRKQVVEIMSEFEDVYLHKIDNKIMKQVLGH